MNEQNYLADDIERYETLREFEDWLEGPVIFLGFVWLVLLLVELIWGLNPFLEALGTTIWIVFILDFGIRLILAPNKGAYLRRNWLTALSLLVPALRIFRITRVLLLARGAGSVRFVKVISSVNRGMKALRASLKRRGIIYITALTLMITFIGAGGLLGFEQGRNSGFSSYGESLWRTAMIITTMGTGAEPKSMEGRALVLLLALYSFAIFGYITATLATFFIGRDAQENQSGVAGQQSMDALRDEIRALRAEIEQKNGPEPPG